MVTQIINADQNQPRIVTFPTSPVPGQSVAPVLQVGQVLPLVVRQNFLNGEGLIFFQGQLITAGLPKDLQPGSRLFASVTSLDDKVVLKLIESSGRLADSATHQTAQTQLSDLSQLLERLIAPNSTLEGAPPLQLPAKLEELLKTVNKLDRLLNKILTSEQLEDPKQVLKYLQQLNQGGLGSPLKELAAELKRVVANSSPPTEQQLANTIRDELTRLLDQDSSSPPTTRQFEQLLNLVNSEARDNKRLSTNLRQTLRAVAEELRQQLANPEQDRIALTQLRDQLSPGLATRSNPLTGEQSQQLQEFSTRLEQLAANQETITQLNQLMKGLGEPALLLFPYLFQGMLAQGEVVIEPRLGNQNQGVDEDGSGKGGKSGSPYQRVQVAVPLPHLGTVDVDIAHRPGEVFARFTVQDPEVGAFLLEQLEHLAAQLREQGYENAELVAHVGPSTHQPPAWVEALGAATSVIA